MTAKTPTSIGQQKGALYTIFSGLLFSLIGYFGIKIIGENISVATMLFWRFFIASITTMPLLIPKLKSMKLKTSDIIKVVIYGVIFYAPSTMLYFFASRYIGTGLAMVVFFTYPAFVMVLNWTLYNAKITKTYVLSILIILLGMTLLVDTAQFNFNMIGLGLSLLSALCYACYIVASKKIVDMPPLIATLMVSLGCIITCFTMAVIDHSFIIPTTRSLWCNILGLGFICTTLPILFFLKGLAHLNAAKASILSVLEPVFVVFFGILLLHEPIDYLNTLGIIIILGGALLTLLDPSQKEKPPKDYLS